MPKVFTLFVNDMIFLYASWTFFTRMNMSIHINSITTFPTLSIFFSISCFQFNLILQVSWTSGFIIHLWIRVFLTKDALQVSCSVQEIYHIAFFLSLQIQRTSRTFNTYYASFCLSFHTRYFPCWQWCWRQTLHNSMFTRKANIANFNIIL